MILATVRLRKLLAILLKGTIVFELCGYDLHEPRCYSQYQQLQSLQHLPDSQA
jgi:hypothetical protein